MIHNPAVMGTTYNGRILEDGSMELLIIVRPESVNRVSHRLAEMGTNVGLVELAYNPAKWGDLARELRLSGFWGWPLVWKAIGTDQEYQAWVRQQRCARTRQPGSEYDPIVFAHVRRVADGSGTSAKPLYAGIPLLNSLHQRQHQRGESDVHPKGKNWFDEQRMKHVREWAWQTLKIRIAKQEGREYEHWSQIPPVALLKWAAEHNVDQYLPKSYKGANADGGA